MSHRETEHYQNALKAFRADITVWTVSCINTAEPKRRISYFIGDKPMPTTSNLTSFDGKTLVEEQLCGSCYEPGHQAIVEKVDPNDKEEEEIARAFDTLYRLFEGDDSSAFE